MLRIFSHSFANGGGNSFAFTKAADVLGLSLSNSSVNGDMCFDKLMQVYGVTPASGDECVLFVGTNDQWKYGVDSAKLAAFKSGLKALARYLKGAQKCTAGTVTAGSWYDNVWGGVAYTPGKASATPGSKLEMTFSGDVLDFMYTIQGTSNGSIGLKVDGNYVGSVNCYGPDMTTNNGKSYGPAHAMFDGFGAGSHTLEMEHTGGSGTYVYADAVGGDDNGASVWICTPPRYRSGGYAVHGGSEQNMADYAQACRDAASEIGVGMIDLHASLDPSIHIRVDDLLHPTDGGQGRILVDITNALVA